MKEYEKHRRKKVNGVLTTLTDEQKAHNFKVSEKQKVNQKKKQEDRKRLYKNR